MDHGSSQRIVAFFACVYRIEFVRRICEELPAMEDFFSLFSFMTNFMFWFAHNNI
jgi:hypothetical protein